MKLLFTVQAPEFSNSLWNYIKSLALALWVSGIVNIYTVCKDFTFSSCYLELSLQLFIFISFPYANNFFYQLLSIKLIAHALSSDASTLFQSNVYIERIKGYRESINFTVSFDKMLQMRNIASRK